MSKDWNFDLPIACEHVQESLRDEKTNKVVRWWQPRPCKCGGPR